nr:hypothetical protein [Tanacetum cinerariifolium]
MQTQTFNTLHNAIMEAGSKDRPPMLAPGWKDKEVPTSEGSLVIRTERVNETYKNVSQDIRDQLNAKAEAVQIILTGIDNDIYSTVDACPNACEMWKAIERLKHGESINHEVNEIRAEKIARIANPLALVALQQPVYHPQTHPTHYTHNSSTRSQQATARNRGKATVNTPQPIYDQGPSMVDEDDETSKDKEIDKLMALISLSNAGYENQWIGNVAGAKETVEKRLTRMMTLMILPKNMDESIPLDKQCQSSLEIFKVKLNVNTIITGVELCKQKTTYRTYIGYIDPFIQSTIESNFCPVISRISDGLNQFLRSQLETQKTQFLNEIDRLFREYYYADHMNAILGVYTKLDEVTNLQCDYLELLEKSEGLETELSKSKMMSKSFESVQKHAINLELELQQCKEKIKNDMLFKVNKSKDFCKEREQYFKIQDLKAQLQDKGIVIRVISTTSVSRPQLKSNPQGDRVMHNNSQGKKQEVEDHCRSVKLSKNKMTVTACNDNLNAKTLNVKSVSAMYDKCVLHDKHGMCVLKSIAKPLKETVASESNKKPRNFTRKLYERVSKTCSWWYPKFTPSGYKWKPKSRTKNVYPNVSMPLGNTSRTANVMDNMTSRHSTVDDQIAPILEYGDLVQGAVTIKRVYYVEGLNHNLFSAGQFCDADLEVAFRKSTCFIRDLKGNDLLTGFRGTDLYSNKLQDTNSPNPICLMAKATSSQAWLWHRRLSHLNFDTINLLSKNDIVVGLPKL